MSKASHDRYDINTLLLAVITVFLLQTIDLWSSRQNYQLEYLLLFSTMLFMFLVSEQTLLALEHCIEKMWAFRVID